MAGGIIKWFLQKENVSYLSIALFCIFFLALGFYAGSWYFGERANTVGLEEIREQGYYRGVLDGRMQVYEKMATCTHGCLFEIKELGLRFTITPAGEEDSES